MVTHLNMISQYRVIQVHIDSSVCNLDSKEDWSQPWLEWGSGWSIFCAVHQKTVGSVPGQGTSLLCLTSGKHSDFRVEREEIFVPAPPFVYFAANLTKNKQTAFLYIPRVYLVAHGLSFHWTPLLGFHPLVPFTVVLTQEFHYPWSLILLKHL